MMGGRTTESFLNVRNASVFMETIDMNESLLTSHTYDSVLGVYDVSARARIIFSRPQHVIAVLLAFVTIVINTCSLLALSQVKNRLTTHFRLIISLSLSDILVGVSVVLHIVNKVLNPSREGDVGNPADRLSSRCTFLVIKSLNTIGLNVSLLNLMGMSMDHYIAITRPLHYPKLLNKLRSRVMIVTLWVVATICGLADFFSAIPYYNKYKDRYNLCEIVWWTSYQDEYTVLVMAAICFTIMMFIYIRIYLVVRQHRSPGEQNLKQEVTRNRRALCTTLLILGSFVICWLPYCLYQIILVITMSVTDMNQISQSLFYTLIILDKYLYDLLLINCICDPIIYTVRTFEVKLGYRRLFRRCICCLQISPYYYSRSNVATQSFPHNSSRKSFHREPRLSSSSFLSIDGKIPNIYMTNLNSTSTGARTKLLRENSYRTGTRTVYTAGKRMSLKLTDKMAVTEAFM